MSFTIIGKGKVQFQCRGCKKKAETSGLLRLPKGWYVTGVLQIAVDPEQKTPEEIQAESQQKLADVGANIGAHFHSRQCATEFFDNDALRAMLKDTGVTLAIYGQCEIIVDGAGMADQANQEGISAGEAEGKPPGSPPPFTLGDGGCP